jgi:hypothetical protein
MPRMVKYGPGRLRSVNLGVSNFQVTLKIWWPHHTKNESTHNQFAPTRI